jgi:hypothetical protein
VLADLDLTICNGAPKQRRNLIHTAAALYSRELHYWTYNLP